MTLNEMAWLLATHPDPNVLDAREAVKLAERAAELTNNQDAVIVAHGTLSGNPVVVAAFDFAFLGGSMGVAAKNMNRNFIGIEKDPEIYEVAVNRIEN